MDACQDLSIQVVGVSSSAHVSLGWSEGSSSALLLGSFPVPGAIHSSRGSLGSPDCTYCMWTSDGGRVPGDTPTGGSIDVWVTPGDTTASCLLCREAQLPLSLPAEILLKGMQTELLEHCQVLLTWLLCFLNITTRYRAGQQEGSSPREAPSKPHSELAVSCSLPPISSQQRLYRAFPLPWGDWELYSHWNQMGTHGWSQELGG